MIGCLLWRLIEPIFSARSLAATLAVLILHFGTVGPQALETAQIGRSELVSFPTNVPDAAVKAVTISGRLYLPNGVPPFSAVVIIPSSGGEKPDREYYYAEEFAKAGIAGLVVESFLSRGVRSSVHDQSLLLSWWTENDAIGALRWLIHDGRFRPDRIGITGVSKGGGTALNTALAIRRVWTKSEDLVFAAHAPIAPFCNITHRSLATTGKPIFFMLAEHDDQTKAAPCVNLAESLRRAGQTAISIKIYEGAHHAWETLGTQPFFDPRAENYSDCHGTIEDDGTHVMTSSERVPGSQFRQYAIRTCMRLGTHCCGGTMALKSEATRDLIDFFHRSGL